MPTPDSHGSGRGCAKRSAAETIALLPLHLNQARCELDIAGTRAMAPACVCGLDIKHSTAPNVTELPNLATRDEFQSICLLPHIAQIVYTCLQNPSLSHTEHCSKLFHHRIRCLRCRTVTVFVLNNALDCRIQTAMQSTTGITIT